VDAFPHRQQLLDIVVGQDQGHVGAVCNVMTCAASMRYQGLADTSEGSKAAMSANDLKTLSAAFDYPHTQVVQGRRRQTGLCGFHLQPPQTCNGKVGPWPSRPGAGGYQLWATRRGLWAIAGFDFGHRGRGFLLNYKLLRTAPTKRGNADAFLHLVNAKKASLTTTNPERQGLWSAFDSRGKLGGTVSRGQH